VTPLTKKRCVDKDGAKDGFELGAEVGEAEGVLEGAGLTEGTFVGLADGN